jgi:phage shock protein PspC (stress-responsive transcriptional regulator)
VIHISQSNNSKRASDMKRLYLSNSDKKIGGVCGGIGEYYDKDPTLIRILFILVILFSFGFGILAYLAMWLIIPKKPDTLQDRL